MLKSTKLTEIQMQHPVLQPFLLQQHATSEHITQKGLLIADNPHDAPDQQKIGDRIPHWRPC